MKQILSQVRSLDELRASPVLKYVHPLLQSKWLTANNYNKNTSPELVGRLEQMVNFHAFLKFALFLDSVWAVAKHFCTDFHLFFSCLVLPQGKIEIAKSQASDARLMSAILTGHSHSKTLDNPV